MSDRCGDPGIRCIKPSQSDQAHLLAIQLDHVKGPVEAVHAHDAVGSAVDGMSKKETLDFVRQVAGFQNPTPGKGERIALTKGPNNEDVVEFTSPFTTPIRDSITEGDTVNRQ